MAHQRQDTSFFLAEPSPLPELDSWVEAYVQSGRRFTFSEGEVLQPLWEAGEDIRLREDSRFQRALLFRQVVEDQWQLGLHTVANQALYELFLDELWDGRDLCRCLEEFDQSTQTPSFHIFCSGDERLILSRDENGLYHLSLKEKAFLMELTAEQRRVIDSLAPQLLVRSPEEGNAPWTTSFILEELRRWAKPDGVLDSAIPGALEGWLLNREEWVRVGIDRWLPKDKLPSVPERHRYAVRPVFSATDSSTLVFPQWQEEASERLFSQEAEQHASVRERDGLHDRVRWRITLRTGNINEGLLPVPKHVRFLYPVARKLAGVIGLPGLWFADRSDLTVWLDKMSHQLFGEDLQNQFAFLEAGQVLEVEWSPSGLIFRTLHVDSDVTEEEARLVDLTHLAQVRSIILESYRVSLSTILSEQQTALGFQTLYEELCERQQHKPSRKTIRAVLSSSPEFLFIKAERKWTLNPEVPAEVGSSLLRRSTVMARQLEGGGEFVQGQPSLKTMIARNRERIVALRSLYMPLHESGSDPKV